MYARIAVSITLAMALTATSADAQRTRAKMAPLAIGDPAGWITPGDYPAAAIRAGRQGRVVADLTVDAMGHVIACKIAISSGTDSLDARTCEIALRRARYSPATDRKGRAIASTVSFPVRWALPTDLDDSPIVRSIDVSATATDVDFEITVGPDGKVQGCRATKQVFPGRQLDPCERQTIGKDSGQVFTKDGKPVSVIIRTTLHRTVTPFVP